MQKSKHLQQHDIKNLSKLSINTISPSQLKTSISDILQTQSFQMKVENRFGSITYHDKSNQQIQQSSDQIINMIKTYQNIIDKKIVKYYTELREKPNQRELNADDLLQIYKIQKELRDQLINFQQHQIRKIKDQQKRYDSIDNIQITIPIEISQTKKKIQELESFIHIAEIKQKKKSQDLVKVEKNNLLQFQKTAMLRTTMQVEMIYQLSVNQREMKINDRLYDFQNKLEEIGKKLSHLNKIVEERHIMVSSNKGLMMLKQKKNVLSKLFEENNKKISLSKGMTTTKQTLIKRQMQNMKKQIAQKQQRYGIIENELKAIQKKNTSFIINEDLNKSLRKSISYNYAETLLKMKKNQKISNIQADMKLNLSMNIQKNSSSLMKPNFKVKKTPNLNHTSLPKRQNSLKKIEKIENPMDIDDIILPITLDKNRRNNPRYIAKNNSKDEQKKQGSLYNSKNFMRQEYEQQIIIQE